MTPQDLRKGAATTRGGAEEKGAAATAPAPAVARSEPAAPSGGLTTETGAPQGASALLPALTAPKGGGAIRGIGEKLSVSAATGTASLSIPLPISPGRAGFGPAVGLEYDSGGGNGAFGIGFRLGVPSITRKTDKGLPRYYDAEESDQYILSGAEDLVPTRNADGSVVELTRDDYRVRRYRPRVEGLFAVVERWIHSSGDVHFRVTTKDNVTHIYGQTATDTPGAAAPRVRDPNDASRVFTWLLEESRDDKGNVVRYVYKAEDGAGVDPAEPSEKSRFEPNTSAPVFTATAQRYLKRVLYCNQAPNDASVFLMELVFDYGEHSPNPTTAAAVPTPSEDAPWPIREDPFSSYRSGFEVRTYRLCRRVLMFHRFAGTPLLVKSTDFTYEPGPAFTYLTGVTQAGYLNDASTGNVWQRAVLPTLVLDYARPVINDVLSALPFESLEGLEGGVDGARKQWVDLDGEGIPGVLIDATDAWFYKVNAGDGELAPPRVVSSMPSPGTLGGGGQQLEDLGGDGQLDLVSYESPLAGYFSRTVDGQFEPLRSFTALPNVDFGDPNLRFIDIDGDGLPDILISEDQAFVWYHSRGKDGFDPLERVVTPVDDDRGPAVVFADPEHTVLLADMSGDGLVDIVRVRNGEVSYWPNLGYGRFGQKITLENSPVFELPDAFDARRVRFGDVDGSGTSDVFYLGPSETKLYFNLSGNGLSAPTTIASLPPADNLTAVNIVDLLGQGTATLVWSSSLLGPRSIFYVDLMGGVKPHLLTNVKNNLGAETALSYVSSTKFYLEDRSDPKTAWLTRLSFPVHVVERVERTDAISNSRLVTTYRYRHGFFDGVEREFRGFARVEQVDAEEFSVGSAGTELFQAPVRTVSWYHTGAWLEKEALESALAAEYSQAGPSGLLVRDTVFEPDTLPDAYTIQDEREAARALRGSLLRQEIYALDGDPTRESKPYLVTEQNLAVRRLQSSARGIHGVFFTHPREALAVHSERNPDDPRIQHDLALAVDDFGNVTRQMRVTYGRFPGASPSFTEQQKLWATLGETDVINHPSPEDPTNAAPADHWHRLGIESERRAYELTALPPVAPGDIIYRFEALDAAVTALVQNPTPQNTVPYDGTPSGPGPQRRLLARRQQLFYKNDLSGPLTLGQLESLALPYEAYDLALTTGLVNSIAADASLLAVATSPSELTAILLGEGAYVQRDADFWAPSGRVIFDAAHFYLPIEAFDPFMGPTSPHYHVTYDTFSLLLTDTRDPFDSVVHAENDYRVLAPRELTDPNLNRVAVAFDALGMLVRTAVMGKTNETLGDTLDNPTTLLEYDLLRWQTQGKPAFVKTTAREVHFSASPTTPFQQSFAYSDGFGRVAMQKVQAEPGPVPNMTGTVDPRWVGTGRTVFNNKGNPVKQYEPFFSATSDFEDETSIVATGVTPIIHYDPLDRVIRTELPDGSQSRVEFDAWFQRTFDPNDAVQDTTWLSDHQAGTPDEQRAATLTLAHADTPTVTHLDSLGRAFLVQTDNGADPSDPGLHDTRSALDVQGNALTLTDARGIGTMQQRFDVLSRRIRTESPDAGVRAAIADVAGKPLRTWDSRAHTLRPKYDALQRPTHQYVRDGSATERLLLRSVYGEALDSAPPPTAPPASPAQVANARGKTYQIYDCAGLVTNTQFDFKGNLLTSDRRLAVAYQTEPDWLNAQNETVPASILAAVAALLETETFPTESTFDALSRITSHTTPDGSVSIPLYNEAGLLEAVHVRVRGGAERTVISNIDYNARGQRILCQYANPESDPSVDTVRIEYDYDPKTFRLAELRSFRGTVKLQHLVYTYDPVGNIVALRDHADTAPLFNTTPVSGDGLYVYDALYRLTQATGREFPGGQPIDTDPAPSTGIPHANDTQALLAYAESYAYDQVGNINQIAHTAGTSNSLGWTRNYQYAATNNRLAATSVPGSSSSLTDTYGYDAHGSMTSMPHLALMEWDYADRLKHTRPLASGADQNTYFTYDAGGQRVRKVFESVAGGLTKERIYLGGYEIYRERPTPSGSVSLERQTLDVTDDQRRVAMAETKTVDGGVPPATITTLWRFQLDNHLGSALLELDEAGNVITYEEYHPYGSTAFSAAKAGVEVSAKRYRYTGKERDDETGLYYHGARYYAPWLGRWTAVDPAGTIAGLNLFEYCLGNPIKLSDQDGKAPTGMDVPSPSPAPRMPPPCMPEPPTPTPPVRGPPIAPRTPPLAPRLPVAPETGGFALGPLLAGAAAFLVVLLTPSNAFTNYKVTYEDPDTHKTLTFPSQDELQGYLNQKAYEKRIAPGANDSSTPKNAPGANPDKGPLQAPAADAAKKDISAPPAQGTPRRIEAPPHPGGTKGPILATHGEDAIKARQDAAAKALARLKDAFPDAEVGFRGSLARGQKGPHKGNAPFDPNNFDVDAFIVSDELAARMPANAAGFRNLARQPEFRGLVRDVGKAVQKIPGVRQEDTFKVRIFSRSEFEATVGKNERYFVR